MNCADEFLAGTNVIFDECQLGVATLSRMVVAAPDALVGQVRAALVPALYAYWERFFRLTFGEFLRCVSEARIPFAQLSETLARFRIRKQVLDLKDSHRNYLIQTLDRQGLVATRTLAQELARDLRVIEETFAVTATFSDPTDWIKTESNVRYEVVEAACEKLGLQASVLKDMLLESKIVLYPRLKELVDTRNDIAHGNVIAPMDGVQWDELQNFVSVLMNAVQLLLYESLEKGEHLIGSA